MRKQVGIFIIVALTVTMLASCKEKEDKKSFDRISVQLKWLHQPQFAGFYAADQKGFYAKENIEATLEPGGVKVNEIEMVISGHNDFGVVAAPEVIVRKTKGAAIKALAVIFRRNPAVFFALKDSGINKPADFVGRKVLTSSTDFALPAMLAKVGIRMDQIVTVPPSLHLQPFFAGEVDVWSGYLTNQVVTARKKGYELNLIFPDDYGIHIYSDTIITSEKIINENPDLVERFLRATLKGWRWAIENPKEAAVLVQKYDNKVDVERQIAEMEASVPLIHTGQDHIGWMNAKVWQGMHDMLINQGAIKEPVDLNQVYTMKFLEKIYGRGP